ncbi:MAG: hypothetical protein B0D84_05220, partial [Candidatus Sedimenticola endophacoides]
MLVVALGGNALVRRGQAAEAAVQRANLLRAVEPLAALLKDEAAIVTHGNGPQVGLLALQGEHYRGVAPYPLDILNAETEGMVGYLIEQALHNRLPGRKIACLLTQVLVDAADPAFAHPEKPVGPLYSASRARELMRARHWPMVRDGTGYRRVVSSPEPIRIIELATIRMLLEAGALVICAGGGGIPVVACPGQGLVGVEAVVDKDLSAALLGVAIGAGRLLLLTDVEGVYADWEEGRGRLLRQECRYLVKDFGTSQSPKSTRQRDSRYCPDRPALITTPSRTLQQSCSCA